MTKSSILRKFLAYILQLDLPIFTTPISECTLISKLIHIVGMDVIAMTYANRPSKNY